MGFERVLGQKTAVDTLERALERRQVHHAYRFEGPEGVGKELSALLLARALVCESAAPGGCGSCSACHRALRFSTQAPHVPMHPDVVLVERGLYPPAQLGRSSPETTGISVQQVRRMVLARMGFGPHEGRALCFIVRAAHELTTSAANALLKTLEEPPANTYFVLLTHRPGELLDTVRSRTLAVRFGALSDALLVELGRERGVTPELAALAEGSVSIAISLASEDTLAERNTFTEAALSALDAPDFASALGFIRELGPNREEIGAKLSHLAVSLATFARNAVSKDPERAERFAHCHRVVLDTLRALQQNAQPTLALEAMILKLRRI
jgi:DNA polymerase-3 subunit delta'